jgi:flagellar hook-basal body complex protein FliE
MSPVLPVGPGLEAIRNPGEARAAPGFADALHQAVEDVNRLQGTSAAEIQSLVTGESEDLHTTLLAVQRSELAFQFLLEVRNKVVQAYQEIMRIQV